MLGPPWWSSGQDSAPNAGGLGLDPDQRTGSCTLQPRSEILHATTMTWRSQINKLKKNTHTV